MKGISIRKRIALELNRQLRKERVATHPLRQLFWECTHRCNLNCRHCGSDCKLNAEHPDMPAADFLKVLDSLKPHVASHKLFIIITGGEPLMRADLEEVGRAIYDREYPWGIVTNGLALSPSRFKRLLAAGLHSITVSLDGLEENHNWMRGNPASYSKALSAIKMIAATPNIAYDVVTCVNSRSLKQLDGLKAELIKAGVKHWRLFTIFPSGRARQYPEFNLSNEEFTTLMEFIAATRKEGKIHASYCCEGFLGGYEMEVRDHFYTCEAGITVGSVLIDGSISACPSIRANYSQGNIYKDDFWDVWNNRYQPFRDRQWMKTGICKDCSMFRYCEGNGFHLREEDGSIKHCHIRIR
ncbi:MAG: TIGR04133 family radical SAM/SPASM protein [Muribaculum sp.]|nr:TIGR04133 family radical SAM/SPASM protein [Muribaculum sp.]